MEMQAFRNRVLSALQAELGTRYEDFRFVGQGAMGAVYRARHRLMQNEVAIKAMLPGESTLRFLREARILAAIRSPHVVLVHDFEVLGNDELPLLIMEWIEGIDLQRRLKEQSGPLDEAAVLPGMRDVCDGMRTVAREGIVHRDLKPSNILIDQHGTARVTDFGLARAPSAVADISQSHEVMGTPYYMSPEQAEQPRSIDSRADIYSFGATFYHLLTGAPMFKGDSAFAVLFKHKTEPIVPPSTRNPRISAMTSELLERCVAKSPDDRFPSFDAIAQLLQPDQNLQSPWEAFAGEQVAPHVRRFESRRHEYLQRAAAFHDAYALSHDRRLHVLSGDIREQTVDALVSSDDELLSMTGGVSLAIAQAAGPEIRREAARFVPARQGRAVVTSAGQLPQRYVFHGITLDYSKPSVVVPSRDVIAEILESCFYQAETLHVTSLAFPLLGTGTGGFPRDVALDTMFRVLLRLLLRRPTCVREAMIVIYRP
jgi:eukaryotic-like serine/threonine-protein kinase